MILYNDRKNKLKFTDEILEILNTNYNDLDNYKRFFAKKKLLFFQDWKCGICDKDILDIGQANLDHNHESGRIRGVLCNTCNRGLGCFKDNTEQLVNAIRYLTSRYVSIKEKVLL